jgi:alkylation response protein AidB-like acyl-CoA dehydrogenase
VIDFTLGDEQELIRRTAREFCEREIAPHVRDWDRAEEIDRALVGKLAEVGLLAPTVAEEHGGMGLDTVTYCLVVEEVGRVDSNVRGIVSVSNGLVGKTVAHWGTDEQRAELLSGLASGERLGCYALTEPGAGSDPGSLQTRAERDGDDWVINAHKWFSSGADGAGFGVVMVVTDPDGHPHRRASMILVPTDAPGYEMVRRVPVMGHEGRGWGTHCETRFTDVRVPVANTLGEPGDGFRIAQKRLGPGRIHHVMRWLGQMQRAFELMCSYSLERKAFGGPLAEKQTVQNWIAESAAEIQACRLMTLQAAHRLDEGDEARVEISLIKFHAARVLHDVIDRAIQVHGGLGLTDDMPLAVMYRMARGGRIYDGADEVHKMVVARRILRSFENGSAWRFT